MGCACSRLGNHEPESRLRSAVTTRNNSVDMALELFIPTTPTTAASNNTNTSTVASFNIYSNSGHGDDDDSTRYPSTQIESALLVGTAPTTVWLNLLVPMLVSQGDDDTRSTPYPQNCCWDNDDDDDKKTCHEDDCEDDWGSVSSNAYYSETMAHASGLSESTRTTGSPVGRSHLC
eukprot:PhF_6_TR13547/c0_g1_i4/m.21653